MVCVGSLVKLKYKTRSTIVDREKGLIDCWLEIEKPGIIVRISDEVPIPVCDIAFGDQVFYSIACEDIEVIEKNE